MDDKANEKEVAMAWRAKAFPPINFSNIPFFSHRSYDLDVFDFIPDFHGEDQSAIDHMSSFVQVMVDFDITHEEDWLQIFALSFINGARDWFYDDLPINHIDSLFEFFCSFVNKWPPVCSINPYRFCYQATFRLPKEENPVETYDDQPLDCEEHVLEDPIENLSTEEILEECNESIIENFADEIIVEHKENNISSVEIFIDINHDDQSDENCEEHIFKALIENPLNKEILKDYEESLFENHINESIIEFDIGDLEIFTGEPIYDSSSDESFIVENFERPVSDESLLDHYSYVSTSSHAEATSFSDSPIFDEYPCESPVFHDPLEDQIYLEPTHIHSNCSPLSFSPTSSCHLLESENHHTTFPEGPHDIVPTSYECPYDGNPFVSPVHLWIEACCDQSFPLGENFNKYICANNLIFQSQIDHEQVVAHCLHLMTKSDMFWSGTKHGGKRFHMYQVLRWLHWLYNYS